MLSVFPRGGTCALALFAGLFAGAAPVQAQTPVIQSVVTYRVKPDRMSEWSDLRKQLVAIYKKAGLDYNSTVWQAQSGPMEYGVVRYYSKWAGLGAGQNPKLKEFEAQITGLNNRMMACVDSMERRLATLTDWSMRPPAGAEMPKMVRVLRTTVRQGHMDDYLNLVKSEVAPAYKQAGVKMMLVSRPAYGGASLNEVMSVVPISWEDLDGPNPLTRALGQDGYTKLMKKLDEHVTRREAVLYRFMPDLSYTTGGSTPSSSGN